MPPKRTLLTAIVCIAFAAGAVWTWRAFEIGYIIAPWNKPKPVFCDGRVAKEFPKFWANIASRKLLPAEGYSISVSLAPDHEKLSVALRNCKPGPGKHLTCKIDKDVPKSALKKGQDYRLDPADVVNWTYHRNFKFYHGCNILKLFTTNLAAYRCERAARQKFVDFAYAVETRNVDPQEHWVDIELQPVRSGRDWERLEARLHRCQRRGDGKFACKVESAPPETGIAIDDWRVVEAEQVLGWMYTIDKRRIKPCDGEDLSAYKNFNEQIRDRTQ